MKADRRLIDANALLWTFSMTLRSTGTLGRSRTRRPAVGTSEAVAHLRRVIDESPDAAPTVVLDDARLRDQLRKLQRYEPHGWNEWMHAADPEGNWLSYDDVMDLVGGTDD